MSALSLNIYKVLLCTKEWADAMLARNGCVYLQGWLLVTVSFWPQEQGHFASSGAFCALLSSSLLGLEDWFTGEES